MNHAVTSELDHLVFAGPDLAAAVGQVEELLGVRGTPGGAHPGLGTRNVLFSLGATCYLEVIGPDPDQPDPAGARPFGIDRLTAARLVTWAARPPADTSIEDWVEGLGSGPAHPGPVAAMSRRRPDGELLQWQLTRAAEGEDGTGFLRPFLIDWGATTHPAGQLPAGPTFLHLEMTAPAPGVLGSVLQQMAVDRCVGKIEVGDPALRAVLCSAGREIVLD